MWMTLLTMMCTLGTPGPEGMQDAATQSAGSNAVEVAGIDDRDLFPGVRLIGDGARLTVGGFAEVVGIYRQHFVSEDIATSFVSVPFPTQSQYFAPELRLSSRQTRLSMHVATLPVQRAQGALHLEIDFLGAAVTANSVQSNSFTPRMRHGYASFSWAMQNLRFAVVAGQTWSLVMMSGPALALGSETPPQGFDAQMMPGFMWARQPQVRAMAYHPRSGLSVAASLENPQTTFLNAAPPGAVTTVAGGFLFNPGANMSLSHIPDGVLKVAYDGCRPDVALHAELFGIGRVFSVRSTEFSNENAYGGGVGAGARLNFPRLKDLQLVAAGAYGAGIGRYGSAQFVDATVNRRAIPQGKAMSAALLAVEASPHPAVRVFAAAGMERVDNHNDLPDADNRGCKLLDGACTGANGMVADFTGGIWATLAQRPQYRLRLGAQAAFIRRTLVPVAGVGPTTWQSQGYLGFRCDM